MAETQSLTAVEFETHPSKYRHWKLTFDGEIAVLGMDVKEDAGLRPDYQLKLNSYDLGVDIELADAIQRLRFEHPEVKAVLVTSLKERIFCAGANIFMLGVSSHPFKVNFCKFTNETRIGMEDASEHSGLKFLAALNGICAGGGYELALACDRLLLVDDASSAVSLPEVPLLGVLPGTGGVTRIVDKRKVRRDLADFFCSTAEGVKGKRAQEWGFVDAVVPRSKWNETVQSEVRALAAKSDRGRAPKGIALPALAPSVTASEIKYRYVTVKLDAARRLAELTIAAPASDQPQPKTAAEFEQAGMTGAEIWALRAFRELDDALLRLRFNHLELGTIVLRATGSAKAVLAADAAVYENRSHWLVREIHQHMKRVLKRLDNMSRTLYAFIEPGNAFAGSLFEIAMAADRQYMLDDDNNTLALGVMNAGSLKMANGLSRLETRFYGVPGAAQKIAQLTEALPAEDALKMGLVTFAPDDIDWEDETRLALEERASFSPDALTGLEQNVRFVGPETMETKIFGRLTAWQNWIFTRPNATGEKGALTVYGKAGQRPEFDLRRT